MVVFDLGSVGEDEFKSSDGTFGGFFLRDGGSLMIVEECVGVLSIGISVNV